MGLWVAKLSEGSLFESVSHSSTIFPTPALLFHLPGYSRKTDLSIILDHLIPSDYFHTLVFFLMSVILSQIQIIKKDFTHLDLTTLLILLTDLHSLHHLEQSCTVTTSLKNMYFLDKWNFYYFTAYMKYRLIVIILHIKIIWIFFFQSIYWYIYIHICLLSVNLLIYFCHYQLFFPLPIYTHTHTHTHTYTHTHTNIHKVILNLDQCCLPRDILQYQ